MIKILKNPKDSVYGRGINTLGPNDDYPLPWVIESFPGTQVCSIIAGEDAKGVNNTVVSMIDIDTAYVVLEEVGQRSHSET